MHHFNSLFEVSPSLYEQKLRENNFSLIAGTDEVGRGCLAGPVIAAAVILPHPHSIQGIKDSKLLKAEMREELYDQIRTVAISFGVGIVEVEEIDRVNIFHASLEAMRQAVMKLSISPEFLLVDGMYPVPKFSPQKPVIKGDQHCQSIAAASIIAKVTRDRLMVELEKQYPNYSFSLHKGYPTKKHREEIQQAGISPIHRRSFKLL